MLAFSQAERWRFLLIFHGLCFFYFTVVSRQFLGIMYQILAM